jgi:hypothetical protein
MQDIFKSMQAHKQSNDILHELKNTLTFHMDLEIQHTPAFLVQLVKFGLSSVVKVQSYSLCHVPTSSF